MPTLSFNFDWVAAERVKGPELSATWAALEIVVADGSVTRVLDTRAKTVRDFIYVPLYPLAEWLATNWWFLTHECGNPVKDGSPAFRRRHGLAANREGYAFPDLEVIPAGAMTRLAWRRGSPQWGRVEFLDGGEAWIDSAHFRETCGDFIDQVIRRLVGFGIEDTLLQTEWEAIQSADEEETEFCIAAAKLGCHPYSLSDVAQWWVFHYNEQLGQLLDESLPIFSADTPGGPGGNFVTARSIKWAITDAQQSRGVPLARLLLFAGDYPTDTPFDGNPWAAGYQLARRLRRNINLKGDPLPTMKDLADRLDEDEALLEQATEPIWVLRQTAMIDGLVTRTDDGEPAFGLRHLEEEQRRFHFCRALAELLTNPASDALITRAYSERQQFNRAFAAEFLAPSSGLRERINHRVVDGDTIDELALHFGVSSRIIEHQIASHRIATVSL